MAVARGWDRFGDRPDEGTRRIHAPLHHPAGTTAHLLAAARAAWGELFELLGGASGLAAVLAITAIFSPVLTYGMVAPLVHLWQPAASATSALVLLPVVWLLTSAWVLLSALRR